MNDVTAFMRRIEDTACPECGTRGYMVLPSRGNCQTCLALRLRYLAAVDEPAQASPPPLVKGLGERFDSAAGSTIDLKAERIRELEAALTEMAGTYYYHPRLLDRCNEILRRVGLPDFVKPSQSDRGAE